MKQNTIVLLFLFCISTTVMIAPVLSLLNVDCELSEIMETKENDKKEKTDFEMKLMFQHPESFVFKRNASEKIQTKFRQFSTQYKPEVNLPPPESVFV